MLLDAQSKKFNQSKPKWFRTWHGYGALVLGLAVQLPKPKALLGKHIIRDVVLSVISLCLDVLQSRGIIGL
jgi:hypothetical protein